METNRLTLVNLFHGFPMLTNASDGTAAPSETMFFMYVLYMEQTTL